MYSSRSVVRLLLLCFYYKSSAARKRVCLCLPLIFDGWIRHTGNQLNRCWCIDEKSVSGGCGWPCSSLFWPPVVNDMEPGSELAGERRQWTHSMLTPSTVCAAVSPWCLARQFASLVPIALTVACTSDGGRVLSTAAAWAAIGVALLCSAIAQSLILSNDIEPESELAHESPQRTLNADSWTVSIRQVILMLALELFRRSKSSTACVVPLYLWPVSSFFVFFSSITYQQIETNREGGGGWG